MRFIRKGGRIIPIKDGNSARIQGAAKSAADAYRKHFSDNKAIYNAASKSKGFSGYAVARSTMGIAKGTGRALRKAGAGSTGRGALVAVGLGTVVSGAVKALAYQMKNRKQKPTDQ